MNQAEDDKLHDRIMDMVWICRDYGAPAIVRAWPASNLSFLALLMDIPQHRPVITF